MIERNHGLLSIIDPSDMDFDICMTGVRRHSCNAKYVPENMDRYAEIATEAVRCHPVSVFNINEDLRTPEMWAVHAQLSTENEENENEQ